MEDDRTAFAGKPLKIEVPCAGLDPGTPVTVKVFEPRSLGGDPIETLTAKVSEEGSSASVQWTYDHAKYKDKVAQARFVFLVEGAGRTSISPPVRFLERLELTIADEHGHPAAGRLVNLHPDRGETIPAATNAEGKLAVLVHPGDYHFELLGEAPPELERPPVEEVAAAAAIGGAAGAAGAAAAAPESALEGIELIDDEEGEEEKQKAAGEAAKGEPRAKGEHFAAIRLLEPDGKPASGVKVFLVAADGSRREATTGSDGDARWEDLGDGPFSLELEGDEYVPELAAAAPAEEPREETEAASQEDAIDESLDGEDDDAPVRSAKRPPRNEDLVA